LGFIDIVDIVTYLSKNLNKPRENELIQPWYSILEIANVPCSKVANFSNRNPTLFMDYNESLQNVIDDIAFDNYHRIAIMKDNYVVGVLTQSTLLQFFYQNKLWESMGTLAIQSVESLKLGMRKVFQVTADTQVMQAFELMVKNQVSSLAVVDENNKIIGNLSASDLKIIGYDMQLYSKLFGTVRDFLHKQLSTQYPITVTSSTVFSDVLAMFDQKKVHRVFVVNEDQNLIGVITPGDILLCFQSPHLLECIENKQKCQT